MFLLVPLVVSSLLLPIEPPRAGKITRSTNFSQGNFLIPDDSPEGAGAAIVIEGDNLTVDFGGAILRGTPETTEPDRRRGTGIRVRGRNVTLRRVRVHGYKVGILAENSPGLKVLDSDLSDNWKQRLASTDEREDLSDWMSFHQNEKDEWLRYGAGIYLKDCRGFEIRNCRIRGGQCGLMLTRCDQGRVWNNDFSFLSGVGLGLYRSSANRVMHNRIDWCVRGYSHGVYNRGQDSAGILVYEQSHDNIFAYNSVTHGGDGFFLWAGQTTMDTGQGGCNGNLLFGNDFSHSPTNGIEATFSRNTFANNKIWECWHGVWGGYSYDTKILGNSFGRNAEGVAIEHGQTNEIVGNTFFEDNLAIRLWANPTQDPNWGYPKHRDTASHGYKITKNTFFDLAKPAVHLRRSRDIYIRGNLLVNTPLLGDPQDVSELKFTENREEKIPYETPIVRTMADSGNSLPTSEENAEAYRKRFDAPWNPFRPSDKTVRTLAPTPLKGGIDPFLKPGALRGRRYILIDSWGPYDFGRPLLHPRTVDRETTTFEILGPPGRWTVKNLSPGIRLIDPATRQAATSGTVPGRVAARIENVPGKARAVTIDLEYIGRETRDYRGIRTPAGKPFPFGYASFFAPIDWKVQFYSWEKDKSDPRTRPDAFDERRKGEPLAVFTTDRLDFAGYGKFRPGVPADYFATVAEGNLDVDPGVYLLEVTTDDGCRVFVDEKPVIADAWKYQGPTLYTAPLTLSGKHKIRVEHFQIDGYATLRVRLRPAEQRRP
ncbi:MAG: right-handed parallel beta-helix repeat-containing protein [Capsulimonadales bacterium]|nr:right-handed parallel beta-helix repeat-containing protein [Capsulimonadales bacterium]